LPRLPCRVTERHSADWISTVHDFSAVAATNERRSFSPLALWLGCHTSPELLYLKAHFAALLPYGASVGILGSVLPLERATSITTWKRHVAQVGERLDEEAHHRLSSQPTLNQFGLPTLNPLRAVGIDGGYVKASEARR
jgi:hypothetical protein